MSSEFGSPTSFLFCSYGLFRERISWCLSTFTVQAFFEFLPSSYLGAFWLQSLRTKARSRYPPLIFHSPFAVTIEPVEYTAIARSFHIHTLAARKFLKPHGTRRDEIIVDQDAAEIS